MKSFLKFIGLTFLYVVLFSVFPILIDGSFKVFENHFAVLYTLFYMSALSFSYVYVYEKLKSSRSLLYRFTISIVILSIILFVLGGLLSYTLLKNIQFKALIFQIILGICLFLLEFLVLNFVQNFKSKNELVFTDKPLYYCKLIVILTFVEYILMLSMNFDMVLDEFAIAIFLKLLEPYFILPLLVNVFCFLGLKYLNKIALFKSRNLLLILSTVLIGTLISYISSLIHFQLKSYTILMYGLFAIFATLFYFAFISYRDKINHSVIQINLLSKAFSKKEAEYLQLKNQINPHFLFNNLNTLISFIELNPKKAVEFGHNLSNVYRYYLQNQTEDFVSLQSELIFIKEYLEIYKAKFEKGFTFEIADVSIDYYVLAAAIQELIDNVFKHNVLDDENPLEITISVEDDYLFIKNSIVLKEANSSTKIGLENINRRYQLLTQKLIEINNDGQYFIVKLPILKLQNDSSNYRR